jgi:3-dehydroquinate synthase
MLHDKKVAGGQVIGVWPVSIGRVRTAPIDEPMFHRWYGEGRHDAVLSRGASKGGRPMIKSRSN